MWKSLALALALSAVALQVAYAEPAHAIDVIDKNDLTLFKALADMAGATKALQAQDARVTVLAPTNEAIEAFLTEMGLTVDDLKANEALVDAILGYHVIVGVAAGPAELFAKGDKVKVATAAAPYSVIFNKANGGVTVTDFQGNVASVSKADLKSGKAVVHVIDRVLFSGAYWPTFAKLVEVLPGQFSTLAAAADAAGLIGKLSDKGFSDTLFLPTNAAFKEAGVKLDAPAEQIAEILKYHVVPGNHPIPLGFNSGEPVKTLQGQDIIVTAEKNEDGFATAFVTDAMGNKIKVVHPNLFISKADGHVISGVLMPKLGGAESEAESTAEVDAKPTAEPTAEVEAKPTAEPTAEVVSTATAEAPAAPAAARSTVSHPFGLISWFKSLITFRPAQPAQHDTVSVSITLPSGKGGRKLMQGTAASEFAPTIAQSSSEQAILNAVNNVAAGGSAFGATQATLNNGLLLTSYPVDATYADGITMSGFGAGGN